MRALLLPALLLFLFPAARAKEWRGIDPLRSNRADVERLLGEGDCRLDECLYYLEDVRVVFHYSPGDCGGGYVWNIPKDTVHWITVKPKEPPPLSDLKIDMGKFGKILTGHIEGEVNYCNEAEGVSIQTVDGMVRSFVYGPTAEEERHLHCAENPNKPFSSFSPEIPEEQQKSLIATLNRFVECSQTGQYEEQYEMFLPEYATSVFPVKDKQEFAHWVRTKGQFREDWVELKPDDAWSRQDKSYGKIYDVLLRVKTLEGGKIIQRSGRISAVNEGGRWYLIGAFLLSD